ncbi:DUF302 domain-containing protein [Bacteroidota bacterium]
MKKRYIAFLVSVFIGCFVGVLAVNLLLKAPMMLESESRFDFETTVTTIEQSATANGWSIPTVHDLQKSLAKAGKEINKVKVFAICNPEHSVKILAGDDERIYSNMMPCRVSVYTKSDGKTYVSRLNIPKISKGMPKNVKSVMKIAYRDMEDILAGIIIK